MAAASSAKKIRSTGQRSRSNSYVKVHGRKLLVCRCCQRETARRYDCIHSLVFHFLSLSLSLSLCVCVCVCVSMCRVYASRAARLVHIIASMMKPLGYCCRLVV